MKLHGDNFTNLHQVVDASCLPPFLAGTGPDLDYAYWKREVLSSVGHGEETAL